LKITSHPTFEKSATVNCKIAAFIPVLAIAILAQLLPTAPKTSAQSTPASAELRIGGAVTAPLVLTVADLKKMPRKTLSVVNPHEKKKETYEGVPLEDLLHRAGVPQGEQLRGRAMASYVIARRRTDTVWSSLSPNLIRGFSNLK
jgi:hypothetical protein